MRTARSLTLGSVLLLGVALVGCSDDASGVPVLDASEPEVSTDASAPEESGKADVDDTGTSFDGGGDTAPVDTGDADAGDAGATDAVDAEASLAATGSACGADGECSSGHCVDGVCCDTSCTGLCQACSATKKGAGTDGTCGPIRSGADPDGECVDQGAASCGQNGWCDGAGACEIYPSGASCAAASCSNGTKKAAASCTGTSGCPAQVTTWCNGYGCDGTECRTTCGSDADCVSGYVCSAGNQCIVSEIEPNDTWFAADAVVTATPTFLIDGSRPIMGSIGTSTDRDVFKLVVATSNTVVHFETFDASGTDCRVAAPYNMASHAIRLLDSAGATIVSDTLQAGITVCAALSYRLDAGTYYVQVDKTAVLASYFLSIRYLAPGPSEVEPNETVATATALSGSDIQVYGSHELSSDEDWYSLSVPDGASIRAEVIEGDSSKTCDSSGIDSHLTLVAPDGTTQLAADDDSGRGFCSIIDGTGSSPVHTGAHARPGGTYYLRVHASPSAGTGSAAQFKYRLVVSVR